MAKFEDAYLADKLKPNDYKVLRALVGVYLEEAGETYRGSTHRKDAIAETEEKALKWLIKKSAVLLEDVEELNDQKGE